MGENLHKLEVVIEGKADKLKAAARASRQEVRRMVQDINAETARIRQPLEDARSNSGMQMYQNMINAIKQSWADMKSGMIPASIADGVKGFVKEAQLAAGIKIRTEEWEQNRQDIERASRALEGLQEKQRDMEASGVRKNSDEWKRLEDQIAAAERRLEQYEIHGRTLEGLGRDVEPANTGLGSDSYLRTASATASHTASAVTGEVKQIVSGVGEAVRRIPVIGRVATEAAYIGSSAFKGMKSVLSSVSPVIRKVSGVFGALINRFASGIPIVRRFTGGTNSSNNSFKNGITTLLKYGLGIRSLYMLFNKLRTAMVDGFKNLSQYSATTNANLSTLSSGLSQLKNSLATAFAPILNVVTPILSQLIDYLVSASNALAQFFAALTGQSTYTVAKRVQQDYASSLQDTKDSASNAANEIKKSLMGFDEINKLDDNSGGSSGGTGGGGSSGGGLFQDEVVTNKFSNFAQMIKDAWSDADFTEVGRIVGEKLNKALASIPWDEIKSTCNKIAKSIATFLNGFIDATDWELVGKTLAEGLNTGIGAAYTFVTTFNWKQFGDAIASSINGAIKNIDWAQAGQTISESVKGILSTFNTFIQDTDWKQLGESVKTAIVNIDWSGIVSSAAEAVGSIVGGAAAFVAGLLGDIPGAIQDYFLEKKEECGGSLVKGIFEGIKDALLNVGSWIKENLLNPIVNGFKNAFGIHSPSTVFAELGRYCIEGLFEGLKKIPEGIASIAESIWNGLKEAWDSMGKVLQIGVDLVKHGWSNLKSFVGESVSVGVSLVKKGWSTLTKFVGSAVKIAVSIKTKATKLWNTFKNQWGARTVGIFAHIVSAASSLWSALKSAWDSYVNGRFLGANATITTTEYKTTTHTSSGGGTFSGGGRKFAKGGILTDGQWRPVTAYASGGIPAIGQMFVAREAGPELVGTIGRHTAVMNNDQIVSSVAAGVYSAVMAAFLQQSSNSMSKTPVFNIYVGGKKVTDVVIEEVNSRTIATGRCPIMV